MATMILDKIDFTNFLFQHNYTAIMATNEIKNDKTLQTIGKYQIENGKIIVKIEYK